LPPPPTPTHRSHQLQSPTQTIPIGPSTSSTPFLAHHSSHHTQFHFADIINSTPTCWLLFQPSRFQIPHYNHPKSATPIVIDFGVAAQKLVCLLGLPTAAVMERSRSPTRRSRPPLRTPSPRPKRRMLPPSAKPRARPRFMPIGLTGNQPRFFSFCIF
jgi:hypothetical protein